MRTLSQILQDQRSLTINDSLLLEADFDTLELREILTNPQTHADLNTLEEWEF